MTKGVFFDLYDTLVVTGETTASDWMGELYRCLKDHGLSLEAKEFADRCHGFFSKEEPKKRSEQLTIYERRIHALCIELGVEIDTAGIQQTAAATIEAANKNCHLDKDCHMVLKTLKSQYILALISNFDHSPHIKSLLNKLDLAKYFSVIIISEEVGIKKPDPAIFQLALKKTGLLPDEAIYVGDSIQDDVIGAFYAGITPVLIQRTARVQNSISSTFGDTLNSSPKIPGGVRTIKRLSELIEIVRA